MWFMHETIAEQKEKREMLLEQKNTVADKIKPAPAKMVVKKPVVKVAPINQNSINEEYVIHNMTVTAYDLSVQSCGKPIGSHGYGITASGYNLSNKNREEAKAIAVDPRVIPLGKKVEIIFKEKHLQKYNGVYVARDTGGAIKGNKIDLFMGDFRSNKPAAEAMNFGVQKATVKVFS